ncbi:MAG: AraC family transcriptional regulator [Myxococcota bacterium]
MGQITSLFAWKFIRQTRPGVDRARLLRDAGVDPEAPVDPKVMIPADSYYGLLERLDEDDGAPDLPLRTGASMRCDDYGAFGLAFKSAVDLRGSYARAQRYARVLTSVSTYEVVVRGETASMRHARAGMRRGLLMSNEATLASVLTISREVSTAPVRPRRVTFRHSAPARTALHEAFFGCPVVFDAESDALVFTRADLQVPNKLGDATIARFFDTHLEGELAALADDEGLEQRVRIQVSAALSEGVPKISDTAKRLGMSGRTLQRRLADRGASYQALVDEARRQLAEKLLGDTRYSLAEVAYLTGFSEQSSFTRAFKRWAGQTPRSYRLAAR